MRGEKKGSSATSGRRRGETFQKQGGRFDFGPVRRVRAWLNHWRFGRLFNRYATRAARLSRAIARIDDSEKRLFRRSDVVATPEWPPRSALFNPMRWVSWTSDFAWRWYLTRPYLPMLAAVPAILAAVMLLGAAFAGSRVSASREILQFRRWLTAAIQDGNMAEQRFAAEALVRLNPHSAEFQFHRAAAEADVDPAMAKGLMEELARERKSAKAALWLADAIGRDQDFNQWSNDKMETYVGWLRLAVENDPADSESRRSLAQALRHVGDLTAAHATLLPIANDDVSTATTVAILEKQLGMVEASRARAHKLERDYAVQLAREKDAFEAQLGYATVLNLLGSRSEAIEQLENGLESAQDAERIGALKTALANALVVEAREIERSGKSPQQLAESLQCLSKAISVDPSNAHLLRALLGIRHQVAKSSEAQRRVREAIDKGGASETAHLILGAAMLDSSASPNAFMHLAFAAEANPQVPELLDNMAKATLDETQPDIQLALAFSTAALRSAPDEPRFHQTRGDIFVAMERFSDAIAEFELTLTVPELRPRVRESLAVAYERLGQPAMAERQRALNVAGK